MSRELARARESQRRFLESVSHELKTPLTSIRGYAEALEEGAVAPAEGGRVIAAEADRLERLVLDLLDLARCGRADFAVAHEPVDLAAVASDRRRAPPAPGARAGRSRCSGAPSADDAWGVGDEDRLLQATSNLIENALRLTPAGGAVTVRAAPGGSPSATPARGSPPRTCRGRSSASISTTATAASARSARAWAWRSSRS